MNDFIVNVKSITASALDVVTAIDRERASFEKTKDNLQPSYYEGRIKEYDASRAQTVERFRVQLQAAYNEYKRRMRIRYGINVNAMTKDAAVVNGMFDLTLADIDEYIAKYPNNMTMQNAFYKYAADHHITPTLPRKTEAAALEAGAKVFGYYDELMKNPSGENKLDDPAALAGIEW